MDPPKGRKRRAAMVGEMSEVRREQENNAPGREEYDDEREGKDKRLRKNGE